MTLNTTINITIKNKKDNNTHTIITINTQIAHHTQHIITKISTYTKHDIVHVP